MPKDEYDVEDPLELNGVALFTAEDTTDAMCECFIEEFMRMGYNVKQVFALFRNPQYLGMRLVLEQKGQQFVRDQISTVFARWGRPTGWTDAVGERLKVADKTTGSAPGDEADSAPSELTDPLGAPLPVLKV